MLKHLLSTAVTVAGVCTLLLPQSAQAQFKTTYEEIVAAAKREPAVQWCTGLSQKESRPLVAAFKKAYPDVPQVNDFECSGQDATQRVLSEWKARAPQVDILDADDEVLQTLDDQNLTHVQDWSVFKGSPVEIDPRYIFYKGRIVTVGQAHRVIWFNPKVLKAEDAPKSIEDCANPKYKDIIAADVRPAIFEFLQDAGGPWSDERLKKWAAGVKANNPLWVRGAANAFQVISSGERGLICGQQLHGIFRGNVDPASPSAPVQYIIPNPSIARDYDRLAIAPKPLAPNATILFAAFLASNKGQTAIAEINPGYASVYIDGSYTQKAYQRFGAEILRTSQEVIAKVAEKQNKIILGEWGFPSPAK
jgi:ABC-type Fe3+ transport system substrate-binding protein